MRNTGALQPSRDLRRTRATLEVAASGDIERSPDLRRTRTGGRVRTGSGRFEITDGGVGESTGAADVAAVGTAAGESAILDASPSSAEEQITRRGEADGRTHERSGGGAELRSRPLELSSELSSTETGVDSDESDEVDGETASCSPVFSTVFNTIASTEAAGSSDSSNTAALSEAVASAEIFASGGAIPVPNGAGNGGMCGTSS